MKPRYKILVGIALCAYSVYTLSFADPKEGVSLNVIVLVIGFVLFLKGCSYGQN